MHELSIAQSVVDIVRQYVPEDRLPLVRHVKIKVGKMAGVVPDSLEFCFAAIVNETPLHRAELDIEETPLQSECKECNQVFAVEGSDFHCPGCGGRDLRVVSGTELHVVEIELADPQAGAE
jgi:hydrogenase nickel incorporation protein HypA/HybF